MAWLPPSMPPALAVRLISLATPFLPAAFELHGVTQLHRLNRWTQSAARRRQRAYAMQHRVADNAPPTAPCAAGKHYRG
jgi:hypothetical protein